MKKPIQCCLLLVVSVSAQEYRATLLGTVTDPSGAPIPGAIVRAVKADTNVPRETVTNIGGFYSLIGLDPAEYTVTVTANGFKTIINSGIVLQTAQKLNLPLKLEVGQMMQEVTVLGEQELIQTTTASRGLVFDPIKMQEIPLNGRQAFMLMRLSQASCLRKEPLDLRVFPARGDGTLTAALR